MQEIRDKVQNLITVKWKKLKWFQPANLKTITEKNIDHLAKSLKEENFIDPFKIWKKGKDHLILDGCIRKKALELAEKKGVCIPDSLAAIVINIKNETEAKKAVMAYNSQYAKIDPNILDDWLEEFDYEELDQKFIIDEITFKKTSIGKIPSENKKTAITSCPKCGHEFEI